MATDVGDLDADLSNITGSSSSLDGHVLGGTGDPATQSIIRRFSFASPFTTSNDIGDLQLSEVRSTSGTEG